MRLISFENFDQRQRHADELFAAWQDTPSEGRLQGFLSETYRCSMCGGRFSPADDGRTQPDLRENLACGSCKANTRVRSAFEIFKFEGISDEGALYVTEQATSFYAWCQRNLSCQVLGSEFEPSEDRRASLAQYLADIGGHGKIHFQDVTALTFKPESLDAIISFDVLEHVPDYQAAIAEFFRVLKPGKCFIGTFPFTDTRDTLVRASISSEGELIHHMAEEYHGDPISGGVLCFYHFGWDILDEFRRAGFSDVRMLMPLDLEQCIPYGMWTIRARK